MTVSRAKRASNNKWDKENMKIVACKIRKEDAENNNTTPNSLLRNYIYQCIGKTETEEDSE